MEEFKITPETSVSMSANYLQVDSGSGQSQTLVYTQLISSGTNLLVHFCSETCHWCSDWWYPKVIREYYPIYYTTYQNMPNKFEQAFKIVSKLVEKKRIDVKKVNDFIEIVNEIVETL